jgi:hypothetical protein
LLEVAERHEARLDWLRLHFGFDCPACYTSPNRIEGVGLATLSDIVYNWLVREV